MWLKAPWRKLAFTKYFPPNPDRVLMIFILLNSYRIQGLFWNARAVWLEKIHSSKSIPHFHWFITWTRQIPCKNFVGIKGRGKVSCKVWNQYCGKFGAIGGQSESLSDQRKESNVTRAPGGREQEQHRRWAWRKVSPALQPSVRPASAPGTSSLLTPGYWL